MKRIFKFLIIGLVCSLLACGGGDTQNPGELGSGDIYIDPEGKSGNFVLQIDNKDMAVGNTQEIVAILTDKFGRPVSSALVGCESESDAIGFSPAVGYTGDRGGFSTTMSCELPGSWRVFCYANGGTLQEHTSIVCN